MKKISLAMVFAILLSAFMPVMAADESNIEIAVSSISEGDTYVCGNNIVLSAETNAADIKNIDFYANGEKLPGTVTTADGTLIWYTPSAGNYAVKAKANFTSGAEAESAAVNIKVEENIKAISKTDTTADVMLYKKGWENTAVSETDISDEYAKFSKYSLRVTNMATTTSEGTNPYITLKKDDFGSTETFKYFNLLLYNASEIDANYRVSVFFKDMTEFINIKPVKFNNGWTRITHEIPTKFAGKTIDRITISTDGYGLNTLNEEIDLTKVDYYINGMWLSDSNEEISAKTSIPNGQTDVCNSLSKYTVKYNKAVTNPEIGLYTGGSKIDEGVSAQYGSDYAGLAIDEGVLQFNTEYTVKVGKVEDIFGNVLAAAEYKFKTIETNCDNVKPVPSVVYPAEGASVSTNAVLAAKVIFTGNVKKVEFVEENSVLGEAVQYTGNEYQLSTQLSTGVHKVYAKVTTNSEDAIKTEAVTFTVGTAVSYSIIGITDNARFIIGSTVPKTVAVIDESERGTGTTLTNATDVAKAEFYIDGIKTYTSSEAPYKYELPAAKADNGAHKLTVKVYDIYGGIKEYGPYNYSMMFAMVNDSYENDFESDELTMQHGNFADGYEPKTAEYNGSGVLKIGPMNSGYANNGLFAMGKINLSDTKYAVTEFDVCRNNKYLGMTLQFRDSFWNNTYVQKAFDLSYGDNGDAIFKNDTPYHVTVATDFDKLTYVTYINGLEYTSGQINNNIGTTVYPHFSVLGGGETAVVYIDNYSVKSYKAVSAEDVKEYALLGVENGDRFIANDGYSRTVAVIDEDKKGVNTINGESGSTKLTNATNVEKVVFKIDDVKAAEVKTAPYSFEMPFDKIGKHTLKAEVTDIFGITNTYSANYEVIYGTVKTRETHDYEDRVIPSNKALKGNAEIKISEYNGSNALEIVTPNGSTNNQIGLMDTWGVMGDSKIVCTEFDLSRTGRYTQVNVELADAFQNKANKALTMSQNNNVIFKTDTTYHINVIADYTTGVYTISVDGIEFVRGDMSDEIKNKNQAYIQLMISSWEPEGASTYVDNFKFTVYDTLTSGAAADSALDNVYENASGDVSVSAAVANAGSTDIKVNNICALYDTTGKKLISVSVDPVTVGANEISFKSYNVNAGDGGVVKVFAWNESNSSPITRK